MEREAQGQATSCAVYDCLERDDCPPAHAHTCTHIHKSGGRRGGEGVVEGAEDQAKGERDRDREKGELWRKERCLSPGLLSQGRRGKDGNASD